MDVVKKSGIYLPVSGEVLTGFEDMSRVMQRMSDRWLRPWLFPDPNPMPEFDLFPQAAAVTRRARTAVGEQLESIAAQVDRVACWVGGDVLRDQRDHE